MSSLQILCEKYVQIYQEDLYSPNPDRTRGSAHWHNDNGDLHRTDGPAYVGANGSKEWWINGKAHRTDGPAVEWPDGHKEWWIDDKLHRLDGPAIEGTNGGHKEWWVNGKVHRLDGPAIINADGDKQWWVDDKQYTERGFNRYLKAVKARQDILNKDNPGIEMDI